MGNPLVDISNELAELVQRFGPYVVAVHGRRGFGSSGVHWQPGVILTANHSIQREEDLQVTLPDGRTAEATLAGRDSGSDLAVLKVKGLETPPVELGDSPVVSAGELVLVLGRSPDSGVNASFGAISAVSGPWRTWRGGRLDQYIRLDAGFFPNSSGGLVVDVRGRILGVATAGLSRIAGLAIPSSNARRVAEKLLEKGYVPRGYLGIGIQPVSLPSELRAKLSLPVERGVVILSVEPGGPADHAGLLMGDVLVGLGNHSIEGIEDLREACDSSIGQAMPAKLIRAGQLAEATIVVSERSPRSS